MAGRLLGQLLVMGSAVVGRAVVQAYRQTIVSIPPLIHIQISCVAGSVVSDRTPPSAPSSRACSPPS
uniref:Uncharacterized protein n=1 Tax=Aegilops tauschii subsp. strangulata TaxID=200361 RepID=A0A453IVE4_AEGTS